MKTSEKIAAHLSILHNQHPADTAMILQPKITAQWGFTALELIVVLIVGMSIIALAASKIDLLSTHSSLSEAMSNINTLSANTRNLKTISGYGPAETDLVPQLAATQGIPKNMTLTDTALYNVWGGIISVTSTGPGFSIIYASLPQHACIQLATKTNRGGLFAHTQVNNASVVSGEYTTLQADKDCLANADNTITWHTSS